MPVTGKTGADAIFVAMAHICRLIVKYGAKLDIVITGAQNAGAITAVDANNIRTFISIAVDVCSAFSKLAQYSGF